MTRMATEHSVNGECHGKCLIHFWGNSLFPHLLILLSGPSRGTLIRGGKRFVGAKEGNVPIGAVGLDWTHIVSYFNVDRL